MKKILLVLSVLLSTLLLQGCDDTDFLNSTETVLVKQCNDSFYNVYGTYTAKCIQMYRTTIENLRVADNKTDSPFGNQRITFMLEDKNFKEQFPKAKSISQLWYESTGKTIYDSQVQDTKQSTSDFKALNGAFVISPQMYDELINAVKTCNRATVQSMQFGIGSTLTPEEYNKVLSIIMDCKKYQLENALQQK